VGTFWKPGDEFTKKPSLDARLKNPEADTIEVTDPTHPLFGQRFTIRSVIQPPGQAGFAYVVYQETMTLRIPLAVTDRFNCPRRRTRTKWTSEAVTDLLTLVTEVPLSCPLDPSGKGSRPNCKRKSSRKSRPS
jgi:hypothetical protein